MAWSTPITAAANSVFTASQWNSGVRDNILETAPAKANSNGWVFSTEGTNVINQHTVDQSVVDTSEGTTTAPYVDLATVGPQLAITTGTAGLVFHNCQLSTSGALTVQAKCSFGVSGATTNNANDSRMLAKDGASAQDRWGVAALLSLTAGSNTFTMKYGSSNGVATATFQKRRLLVMGL